ncbi:MAG: hypothetical protein MUP82_06135, partial [Candidatus Marinimicrobia bacterium]|nr:hypothetical protein [Candidatus Neomarinimicrobiota bacterium]
MRQLNNSDNQFGSLDPEKIYFVEKFGYLMKKINGGYGRPVQDALYDRIKSAVNDFKTDLPDIVHNLEKNRLKSISDRSIIREETNTRNFIAKPEKSIKYVEAPKTINEKINSIQKTISAKIKAAPQIKSEKLLERQTQPNVFGKPLIKQTATEEKIESLTGDVRLSKQSGIVENKASSILKPSIAIIKEEQRLKRIKAMKQKMDSVNIKSITYPILKSVSEQSTTKPKLIQVQELTE